MCIETPSIQKDTRYWYSDRRDDIAPGGTLANDAPGGTVAYCARESGGIFSSSTPGNKTRDTARDDSDRRILLSGSCLRHLLP